MPAETELDAIRRKAHAAGIAFRVAFEQLEKFDQNPHVVTRELRDALLVAQSASERMQTGLARWFMTGDVDNVDW